MEEFIKNLAELGKKMHAAHTSYSYEQEDGSFIEINYWTRRPKGRFRSLSDLPVVRYVYLRHRDAG